MSYICLNLHSFVKRQHNDIYKSIFTIDPRLYNNVFNCLQETCFFFLLLIVYTLVGFLSARDTLRLVTEIAHCVSEWTGFVAVVVAAVSIVNPSHGVRFHRRLIGQLDKVHYCVCGSWLTTN
jgi:hypothetical protein